MTLSAILNLLSAVVYLYRTCEIEYTFNRNYLKANVIAEDNFHITENNFTNPHLCSFL